MKRWTVFFAAGLVLASAPVRAEERCDDSPARVVIFTTQACGYCKALKRFLNEEGVAYRECDVEEDPWCAETLVNITNQPGVPVTFVCRAVTLGFGVTEEVRLRYLLGLD